MTPEVKLTELLQRIFALSKVTLDAASDQREQEVGFITLETNTSNVSGGKVYGRMRGSMVVVAQREKLSVNYMSERLKLAAKDKLLRNIFFYDVGSPTNIENNIVETSISFVYFYDYDFDPTPGLIQNLDTSVEVSA